MIAVIPARGGSQRVPRKNIRVLGEHPLIAYSIASAFDSGVFDAIYVSTDDAEIASIARGYGAQIIDRPPHLADNTATDADWLRHALQVLNNPPLVTWAILRPTSPFRTAATIRRAWTVFRQHDTADSIRAVERVTQHPGKMWSWMGDGYPLRPLLDHKHPDGTPWHSSPTQTLPAYYVQNACLEMGHGSNIWTHGTIHGRKVAPFFTEGFEGVDLNTWYDWEYAEQLVKDGRAKLPPIGHAISGQRGIQRDGMLDVEEGPDEGRLWGV